MPKTLTLLGPLLGIPQNQWHSIGCVCIFQHLCSNNMNLLWRQLHLKSCLSLLLRKKKKKTLAWNHQLILSEILSSHAKMKQSSHSVSWNTIITSNPKYCSKKSGIWETFPDSFWHGQPLFVLTTQLMNAPYIHGTTLPVSFYHKKWSREM